MEFSDKTAFTNFYWIFIGHCVLSGCNQNEESKILNYLVGIEPTTVAFTITGYVTSTIYRYDDHT